MAQEQVYDVTNKKFITIEVDNIEDPNTLSNKIYNKKGQRNNLLLESDWTMLSDNSLTEEQKTEATTYRQALRDLPAQEGFPDVEFPTKPDFL
jgi:hypothetical protein